MKRFLPTNSVHCKTSGGGAQAAQPAGSGNVKEQKKKPTLASQLGAFPSTERVLSTQQLHGSTWALQRVPARGLQLRAMGSVLLAEPVPEAAGWSSSV